LEKPLQLAVAVAAGVLSPGGPALADPCTIDLLVASSTAQVVAGLALTLSGLTVMASMFAVRKGLWRYLGLHATERLRRFGSIGLIIASLGILVAARSGEGTPLAQQIPQAWLWVATVAGEILLGAVVLRAAADVVWGRESKWGGRIRYAGTGLAAMGLAGILLMQAWTLYRFDEKLASLPRLKEINSIQRIVQIFKK
jgi:hypothetical protein